VTPKVVVPLRDRHFRVEELIAEFARRYESPKTRRHYVDERTDLFAWTGRAHPAELSEGDLFAWCAGAGTRIANNTIRNRSTHGSLLETDPCLDHGKAG